MVQGYDKTGKLIERCCEGMLYLESTFDKMLYLHEKTVHIHGSFGNSDESEFYDNEQELWTLRALIKNCPWCNNYELKKENKILSGEQI
jgi:hypothetical protein